MNKLLIDTSFLVALNNKSDRYYSAARQFVENDRSIQLIPEVTLTEVTYLLKKEGGIVAVARFLSILTTRPASIQSLTLPDLDRARAIMLAYASARLDFVDCCIMALSERLNISQVATFDRRDFTMFRPTHCATLQLLP